MGQASINESHQSHFAVMPNETLPEKQGWDGISFLKNIFIGA